MLFLHFEKTFKFNPKPPKDGLSHSKHPPRFTKRAVGFCCRGLAHKHWGS